MANGIRHARAIPAKVRSGFASGIAAKKRDEAIPAKVRSGFVSGIAAKKRDGAIPAKVRSGFVSGIAAKKRDGAIPAKVRSGFASGIAWKQKVRAGLRFDEKLNRSIRQSTGFSIKSFHRSSGVSSGS
ncbi:hypothetical protein [Rhizobium sp. CCGE 510]|uniref:hypothetical protein n=1 Tax=Rhizobium sp. CCGE 510 TaxID=1132836 RepID=UPI00178C5F30|nr:hypothetical protein [Rhizobium sp. CCGE 510]